MSASSRSCSSASWRTGLAPSAVANRSTPASRAASVDAVGVTNHVAPSNRSAAARAGPPVSPPATGWPGTKRGSSIAAASARFVEATSVTVASGPAAASAARVISTAAPTGTATTTSSAPPSASASDAACVSNAPRAAASRSVAASASKPLTVFTPARFAASATDVPTSPVPTTASRSIAERRRRGRARATRGAAPPPSPASSRRARRRRASARRGRRAARGSARRARPGARPRARRRRTGFPAVLLVLADAHDELEPAVQRLEQRPGRSRRSPCGARAARESARSSAEPLARGDPRAAACSRAATAGRPSRGRTSRTGCRRS